MKKEFVLALLGILFILNITGVSADPEGWSNDTQISFARSEAFSPSLATDLQDNIHIVWMDMRDAAPGYARQEIYYKKLDAHGNNLTGEIRVSFDDRASSDPVVVTDTQGNAHILWSDARYDDLPTARGELFYKKLDVNGNALTPEKRLTYTPTSGDSTVSASFDAENNLRVIWLRTDPSGRYNDIYYRKFDNAGNPLIPEVQLTSSGDNVRVQSALDSEGNIHLVWDRVSNVVYRKFNNLGVPLTEEVLFTSVRPHLAVDTENNVHVVSQWLTGPQSSGIFYRKLDNQGRNLTDTKRVDVQSRYAGNAQVAVRRSGEVYVFWTDDINGPESVYLRKLDNNGNGIGDQIAVTQTSVFALSKDKYGDLYLAFQRLSDIFYKRSLEFPGITINSLGGSSISPLLQRQGNPLTVKFTFEPNDQYYNLTNASAETVVGSLEMATPFVQGHAYYVRYYIEPRAITTPLNYAFENFGFMPRMLFATLHFNEVTSFYVMADQNAMATVPVVKASLDVPYYIQALAYNGNEFVLSDGYRVVIPRP